MDNYDLRKQKSTFLKLYLYVVDSAPTSSSDSESCIMLLLCSLFLKEMKVKYDQISPMLPVTLATLMGTSLNSKHAF